MRTSEKGKHFIKKWEDCKLQAYPDPKTGGEPYTVGWGHTGLDVKSTTVFTQEEADDVFEDDLYFKAEQYVDQHVKVPLTQGQYDALVSIIFNVGPGGSKKDGIIRLKSGKPSTLLRLLNGADYPGARDEFKRWISPGSNVEKGLKRRREAEVRELWDFI